MKFTQSQHEGIATLDLEYGDSQVYKNMDHLVPFSGVTSYHINEVFINEINNIFSIFNVENNEQPSPKEHAFATLYMEISERSKCYDKDNENELLKLKSLLNTLINYLATDSDINEMIQYRVSEIIFKNPNWNASIKYEKEYNMSKCLSFILLLKLFAPALWCYYCSVRVAHSEKTNELIYEAWRSMLNISRKFGLLSGVEWLNENIEEWAQDANTDVKSYTTQLLVYAIPYIKLNGMLPLIVDIKAIYGVTKK